MGSGREHPGRNPGVYALILRVKEPVSIFAGRLGLVRLGKGLYVYVGSARGPGGLAARLDRHLGKSKSLRWHIDYLTSDPRVSVEAAVYAYTCEGLESRLSSELSRRLEPWARGFGSSDTRDSTHLFRCPGEAECVEAVVQCFRRLGLKPRVWASGEVA